MKNNNTKIKSIKPFLKWAGGKTQLLPELLKYIPENYNKYIEPFIGGGALFFNLQPNNAVISDLNYELITTYRTLKSSPDKVISFLETFVNEEDFYYKIRAKNPDELSNYERAARLIYLNKTCFNGLYRVNKQGQFNVPFGKRSNNFIDKSQLLKTSEYLKNTTIEFADYKETLNKYANMGDLVFLDPPYYPVGKFGDFKRYTKESFYHNDQVLLKEEFDKLVKKGCHVILTNSDHPVIMDLYKDYEIIQIQTKRMINSNASKRTGVDVIVLGGSK